MKHSISPWAGLTLALIVVALGLAMAPAQAGAAGQTAAVPHPPLSHTVEQANATLAQVARDRAAVQDEFAASERVCSSKFFVNRCLDHAKEKRRAALATLRAQEVEANHFKRKDSVEKRDAELAERARKDEEEQALRAQQPPRPPKVVDETPHAKPAGPSVAQRQAEHDTKVKRQAAQDAADAGKRSANVIAFEKKKTDSEQRKAEVERKRVENAQKQAVKAAADKKKEDAAAAAASKQK